MLVLYILMRTDLASMNPGKAVAQGSHASTQFSKSCQGFEDVDKWHFECEGFGTCIVLGVDHKTLLQRTEAARASNIHHGIVEDPSYPLRDGNVTHLIPLETCAWIFGNKDELSWLVGDLPLMA